MQSISKFSAYLNKCSSEVTGRRGRLRKKVLDDLEENKGYWNCRKITRSHSVENSVWKRLSTCRKTDYLLTYSMEQSPS